MPRLLVSAPGKRKSSSSAGFIEPISKSTLGAELLGAGKNRERGVITLLAAVPLCEAG
jgi:hypothetical protein